MLRVFCGVAAGAITLAAFADGLETSRWQAEIDAANAAGGGRVVVPAGRHLVGQLDLKSNVELHLAEGAVLQGSANIKDYRVTELPCSEGTWSAVVFALCATNVAVTGPGTVFGDGFSWPQRPKNFKGCREGLKARGLFFGDCKGVRLEDFTLRDAACWGIVFKRCEDVVARRVKVDSHADSFNDGFDIEAKNVLIEDCDVDSGDDAFCIKSNDPDYTVENVLIRRCVGRSQCNVFKIGTASHGTVRNIRFEDCRCEAARRDCLSKNPKHRGKNRYFWRATKRAPFGVANSAISVECVDGGTVEQVRFSGITFENGAKVPIFVRGGTRTGRSTGVPPGKSYILRDIVIENVTGEADGVVASSITGVDGCRAKNVTLRNVKITCHGAGEEKSKAAIGKPVPKLPGAYPDAAVSFGSSILPAYGLYIDCADNVKLEDVKFTLAEGDVDLRPDIFWTAYSDAAGTVESVDGKPRFVPWSRRLARIRSDDRRFSFRFFGKLPDGADLGTCDAVISSEGWGCELRAPLVRDEMFFTLPEKADSGCMTVSLVRRSDGTAIHEKKYRYGVETVQEIKHPERRKRLNNYVTEVLDAKMPGEGKSGELLFETRRHGWVFIGVSGADSAEVSLDGQCVITNGTPALETVRLVSQGEHRLAVKGAGRIAVREIPMIICYAPYARKLPLKESYDWDFYWRYVVPSVTTMNGGPAPKESIGRLHELGRQWLANVRTLGTAERMSRSIGWSTGLNQRACDGITLDEQGLRPKNDKTNMEFIGAIEKFCAERDTERTVCTWVIASPTRRPIESEMFAAIANAGHGRGLLLNERYLRTRKTEAEALAAIESMIVGVGLYRDTHPFCKDCLGVISGNFTGLLQLLITHHPEVDYNAYLAMQIHALATDPRCDGLVAAGYWGAHHADDDTLRWSFRLMRHYCIEGRTDPIAEQYGLSYIPGHLRNGDFEHAFEPWKVHGDVTLDECPNLAEWAENRYRANKIGCGDTFASFRRGETANSLTQPVRGLVAGRKYALRYATFDVDDMKAGKANPREIPLKALFKGGVRLLPDLSWSYVDRSTNVAKKKGKYGRINLHQVVFAAERAETELVITDEAAAKGERLGVNFVSIRQYLP